MKNVITSNKIKGIIGIFFLSISFYMMKTTTYTRALGDYVLEFIGLRSWSGELTGMHLTVIYFGVLTIILLYVVLKFAVEEWGIRKRWVLLLVIVFINLFSFINDATVRNIKKNSNGLRTIGFNAENSKIEYQSKDMKYVKFNAEIEIVNYGNESKEFYMTINDLDYREDGLNGIDICTKDGKKAIFELEGNENEVFKINLDEYKILGG